MTIQRVDRCSTSGRTDGKPLRRYALALASGCISLVFVGSASAAIQQGKIGSPGLVAVPEDPDWAKYVLLAVIWTLVIAAVIGPIYRFLLRKTTASDSIKYRGW